VCVIAVDEAHLLNTWGASWRKAFRQIGWVRARFSDVVLIALTATMRGGKHIRSVCEFLGLQRGQFHLIRRSNARPDIQILFRTMKSNIGGRKFPELDWILRGRRKTLIFCRTIHLGWRVFTYLYKQSQVSNDPDVNKRIRLYNSLNWPEFNAETRKMMEEDVDCLIAIGTDTMSVGVDLSCVEDVLVLDDPEDVDDLFQKYGRVGRNKKRVTDARGILYLSEGAVERAKRVVDAEVSNDPGKLKKGDTMDVSIAQMVLASCKVDEQDRQYNNPKDDIPCNCHTCRENPPRRRVQPCNCSGCMPESLDEPEIVKPNVSESKLTMPRRDRLTKPMRELGTKRLQAFRMSLWENADEAECGMLPPVVFLPDSDIKSILDFFALLQTEEDLTLLLARNPFLGNNYSVLFTVIRTLRDDFELIRQEQKAKAKAARAARTLHKKAAAQAAALVGESVESDMQSGSSGDGEEDIDEDHVRDEQTTGIRLRINLK
jgi:hypothetical protein